MVMTDSGVRGGVTCLRSCPSLVLPPGPARLRWPASGRRARDMVRVCRPVRQHEGRRPAFGKAQVAAGSDLRVAAQQNPPNPPDQTPCRLALTPPPPVPPL